MRKKEEKGEKRRKYEFDDIDDIVRGSKTSGINSWNCKKFNNNVKTKLNIKSKTEKNDVKDRHI